MKKLSQRELIEEGFGSLVKAAAKGAAKRLSPEIYGAVKTVKDTVTKHLGTPGQAVMKKTKEYPELYDNVEIVEGSAGGSGSLKHVEYTFNSPDDIMTKYHVRSRFKDVGDGLVPFKVEIISVTRDGQPLEKSDYSSEIKDFIQKIQTVNTEQDKTERAAKVKPDVKTPTTGETKPPPLPNTKEPPPLPDTKESPPKKPLVGRRRSASNKNKQRGENEESEKSQKSLLKHLQSMSR
jgi:hypothetical protein